MAVTNKMYNAILVAYRADQGNIGDINKKLDDISKDLKAKK